MSSRSPNPLRALALLLLVSCAGSGDGLNQFGDVLTPDDATFDNYDLIQAVFEARCVRCHDGPGAPQGLELSLSTPLDRLVDVPSREEPAVMLVEAGKPGRSYLWHKVDSDDGKREGARMPRDGPPFLDSETLSLIKSWIRNDLAEGDLQPGETTGMTDTSDTAGSLGGSE